MLLTPRGYIWLQLGGCALHSCWDARGSEAIVGWPRQEDESGVQQHGRGSPPRWRRPDAMQERGRGSPWIERELRALHAMCADEERSGNDENAPEVRCMNHRAAHALSSVAMC